MIFFTKLVNFIKRSIKPYGTAYKQIVFVPKTIPHDTTPWIRFGASQELYDQWIPEICGICCLKMIGDTLYMIARSHSATKELISPFQHTNSLCYQTIEE